MHVKFKYDSKFQVSGRFFENSSILVFPVRNDSSRGLVSIRLLQSWIWAHASSFPFLPRLHMVPMRLFSELLGNNTEL